MSVTIRELLAITFEIEQALIKALAENHVAELLVSDLTSLEEVKNLNINLQIIYPTLPCPNTSWFAMGCSTAQVSLDQNYKLSALLDSRSQVNIMDRQIMLNTRLAMRRGPQIRLISHNGSSAIFLEICENV